MALEGNVTQCGPIWALCGTISGTGTTATMKTGGCPDFVPFLQEDYRSRNVACPKAEAPIAIRVSRLKSHGTDVRRATEINNTGDKT